MFCMLLAWQLQTNLGSLGKMQGISCSGVKHSAPGPSGATGEVENVFSEVVDHTSLSGSDGS